MKNTKLFMFAACTLFLAACGKQTVKIMTPPDASLLLLVISLLDGHSLVKVLCGTKLPTAIIIADYS